jgi:hypothetical protein
MMPVQLLLMPMPVPQSLPGAKCDKRHSGSQMRQTTFREPNATNDIPGAKCDKRHSGSQMRQATFREPNAGKPLFVSVGATECGT